MKLDLTKFSQQNKEMKEQEALVIAQAQA